MKMKSMPTVDSPTEEKVWNLKIWARHYSVKFWNVESLDNLISAQGVLTSIMLVTVLSTNISFPKEKIWVCLTRNNWILKWNYEPIETWQNSKQIKPGCIQASSNLRRRTNGQKEERILIYWIQSSNRNLMTNSRREMRTNFFINLTREVSTPLPNGNANSETLRETSSERKTNPLPKNKRKNEDFT